MCNMSAGAFGSYCADLLAVLRNPNDMIRRQSSRSVKGGSGMAFLCCHPEFRCSGTR
jgi:hypothetical protein